MVVISFWDDVALAKHRISCRPEPRLNCIIDTCVIAGSKNPLSTGKPTDDNWHYGTVSPNRVYDGIPERLYVWSANVGV